VKPLATAEARYRQALRALLDVGAVTAAVAFIASYYPVAMMLSPTTTSGGDMGSQYFSAEYLRKTLLPNWQVIGWCPGNYGGFPLFQFYFPFPFLLMAALSTVIPLQVAFKMITVLGTFLLPLCAYLGLRLLRVPFPGPALGALASLCFLFMEANSMWGGNIPSTLAGEFTFSLGMALAVLFMGTLRATMETGRGLSWNGLLVAIIGLSHGYTLLWAGLSSLTEVIVTRGWWQRVGRLIGVYGLGILIMGFWIVPLLAYSPWTTAYSHVWFIQSWREVLPPILWPPTGVAAFTALLQAIRSLRRREAFPPGLAKVWAAAFIGILFYFTARSFHVVDIRFLPFFQLGLCLAAGAGLGYLLAALPAPEIWPVVGVLAILPFVQSRVTFTPSWITWNYSGYEKKRLWPVFKAVNEHLRGDFRDPRAVFEHSSDHEPLGTTRAFENLPLFSGRSTLEGLYMQASPSAPFIFYTQSEISKEQSCPFPDYGCSRFNIDQGIAHLRMFNVSHFIVRSQMVKTAAAVHSGLAREAKIGEYEIYRVQGNTGRYAIPLEVAPILVLTRSWKEMAYRWFKRAGPQDPVPVFAETVDDDDRRAFAAVVHEMPREVPRHSLGPPPALEERLETSRITITGNRPGHPVLIRISYHPRWRSLTGEKVWLAAPSFMLVIPRGERIDLVFDGGAPVSVGHGLTMVGWLVFLGTVLPVRRRLGGLAASLARPIVHSQPARAITALVQRTERWSAHTRRRVLGIALILAAALFTLTAVAARPSDADSTYRKGQRIYDAGRLRDALPYFREAQRLAPLSNTAIHSTYYESIILYREQDWVEAEKAFQRLIDNFPEAAAAAESLYHIGLCRARRGDARGAVQAWQDTQRIYPGTQWAGYAGERLAEVGKGAGG